MDKPPHNKLWPLGLTTNNRKNRGSMIALIVAFMALVIALIFFGLNYTRLLGSNAEQKKAIESAALAAATDLAGIVVNTDEFGFVSLSDAAPIGQNTTAPDQLSMPVRSINTIIGTARLDLIIANSLNDQTMQQFALLDAKNAQKAAKTLIAALNAAITPSGKGTDKDGRAIYPYIDAVNAYNQNVIRMTGNSSYVPNSMKLTLGSITGGWPTNTPVPQPEPLAVVPANQQAAGFYRSDTDIPFLGQDFVFASVGRSSTLADPVLFVAGGDTTLPYCIPTIVKAEANQFIATTMSGDQVHAVACGVPSSLYDPLPAPGSLSLSFPDGPVPEIKKFADILSNGQLNDNGKPSTLLTSANGDFPWDYPNATMASMPWPINGASSPPIAVVWRGAFYDWIRRGGCKAQIDQVQAIVNAPLNAPNPATVIFAPILTAGGTTGTPLGPVPGGIIHIFKFDPSGNVLYKSGPLKPYPYSVSSNNQMYAEELNALTGSAVGTFSITPPVLPVLKGVSNVPGRLDFTDKWDVYIRDEVRQPGTNLGGKHGGEPMDNTQVAMDAGHVLQSKKKAFQFLPMVSMKGDGNVPAINEGSSK
jgi:hypothetical protein